jgi:hypothetical protein
MVGHEATKPPPQDIVLLDMLLKMMLSSRFLLEMFLQDEITSRHHPGACTHAQAQTL